MCHGVQWAQTEVVEVHHFDHRPLRNDVAVLVRCDSNASTLRNDGCCDVGVTGLTGPGNVDINQANVT